MNNRCGCLIYETESYLCDEHEGKPMTSNKPLDLDALQAVAEAATRPPWNKTKERDYGPHTWAATKDAGGQVQLVIDALSKTGIAHVYQNGGVVPTEAATAHIAAFDPPTVLALIARLRDAEAALLAADALAEEAGHYLGMPDAVTDAARRYKEARQ